MKKNLPETDNVEDLRSLVKEMRHRIKVLDGDTGRDELLQVIKAKDNENKQKEEKVKQLSEKLHNIEQGLAAIEEEREVLTKKAVNLEMEKKSLQKELKNREKEISSLSRRCAEQAERVKEATLLRHVNKELSRELEEMKRTLSCRSAEEESFQRLQQNLQESEKARSELELVPSPPQF